MVTHPEYLVRVPERRGTLQERNRNGLQTRANNQLFRCEYNDEIRLQATAGAVSWAVPVRTRGVFESRKGNMPKHLVFVGGVIKTGGREDLSWNHSTISNPFPAGPSKRSAPSFGKGAPNHIISSMCGSRGSTRAGIFRGPGSSRSRNLRIASVTSTSPSRPSLIEGAGSAAVPLRRRFLRPASRRFTAWREGSTHGTAS